MPEQCAAGEKRPAVFLDRDGTLNENPPRGDYVRSPDDLRLLPGVPEALKKLQGAGCLLVVCSNQSGLARGILTPEGVAAVNARLRELLAESGVSLAGIYYCPHDRGSDCECRKPKPGMLLRAAAELGLDLSRSWGVGDAPRDLEARRAARCRGGVHG